MPIKEKKTCPTHTKEKEESGTCCQKKEEQKIAADFAVSEREKILDFFKNTIYKDHL